MQGSVAPERTGRESHLAVAGSGTARDEGLVISVTIDTEEDNWGPAREGVTIENIRCLPELQEWLFGLGVRPTYFTTWQVLREQWSRDIIRALHDSREAEIGGHLHPWNTPPTEEELTWRNSMTCNLSADLQARKLESLTSALTAVLGTAPISFRTGRFGIGTDTVGALIRHGYRVDSSVSPHINWRPSSGPDYIGAPNRAYRVGPGRDPRVPDPDGELIELPVSSGYNRTPFRRWDRVYRALNHPALRTMRVLAVAVRSGLLRQITLSPETASARDMLTLSKCLIDEGANHLMLLFHSPTMMPGLSPFARDSAGVARVRRTLAEYVDGIGRIAPVRFATASEAADRIILNGGLAPR